MSGTGPAKKPPRFGGPRVRSWGPKSRTGCFTCKRRRVKCDEERPACRRCVAGNRECEGYEEPPTKSWADEIASRDSPQLPSLDLGDTPGAWDNASSLHDQDLVLPTSDAVTVIGQDRRCTRCGLAHIQITCPSSLMPTFFRPSDSPYRRQNEQYLFKFFIEVVGASVSRSNISTYYWLGAFPQIAYQSASVRDTLLAASAAFHQASGDIYVKQLPSIGISSLVYEGRAMRALSQGNPSTYEMLNTSMAFWVCSMVIGNWNTSLQHLYHSLKIISGLKNPSSHDQMHLRYQGGLAKTGLLYFRTTRGPCKKHGPGDFLACDAECFIAEEKPIALRVADSLHHLKLALPTFEMCVDLLQTRMEPHSHQAELDAMLEKEIREVRFLIAILSDIKHLGIKPEERKDALKYTPYTASPFDTVLPDLIRYVVNDQYSTGLVFQELELRTRVTIPHILASTSRGHGSLIQDSLALILHGGYTEGLLKVKGNFKFQGEHIHLLLDDTR